MKNCPNCKLDFIEKRENQTCCSTKCMIKNSHKKVVRKSPFGTFNGSVATKGAIQELKVSADLLRKGYEVYRAVSPSASCDLIIKRKDGKIFRVEVRSCTKVNKGFYCSEGNKANYDVLATVFRNRIMYKWL